MIENIIQNNGKQSDSETSEFLKKINEIDLLNQINNFYANILTPNISEKIQQLVNMKHNFNTDTDDEDIDNDEILEKLKDRNIFNDTIDLEYRQILYQDIY